MVMMMSRIKLEYPRFIRVCRLIGIPYFAFDVFAIFQEKSPMNWESLSPPQIEHSR